MTGRRLVAPALVTSLEVLGVGVTVACQQTTADRLGQLAVGVPDVAMVVVGLLVLHSQPRHRVGRLLVLGPLVATLGSAVLELAVRRLAEQPDDVLARLAATLGAAGRGLGWLLVVLFLPLLFPDGRREGPPRLTAWAWRVSTATVVLFVGQALLSPTPMDLRTSDVDNPVGLPDGWQAVTEPVAGLVLLLGATGLGLSAVSLAARFRTGSAVRRQQIAWLALAFACPIVVILLSAADLAAPWMFGIATLPIPVAVVVAIRQQRLYDLTLALNRSLTYGTLWLLIALLYAVTVGGVGALLRTEGAWLPWVAAGLVAVSFAPLRDGLQRAANRITYGQWSEPGEVLTRTSRRLADAADVEGLLQSLVTEIGEDLALGHVEITDPAGRTLAAYGDRAGPRDALPLTAYGEVVGQLAWTRRDLRETDRALLADLATQLGAVVHADHLLASVRAAQERLVLAREEERRRLRRDLHDGLGPALAGLSLQVDTVRNRLGTDDPDPGLVRLRDGIQETVLDVRRIVEGLRPAALDDLGLLESVRQLADRVAVPVVVEGDDELRLPAAVEVAAYRIVAEALTNVARHSGATGASVCLARDVTALVVRVADDGSGAVVPRAGGVGLGSMRERAEEIGGTLEISDGDGTTVTARLPLGRVP